MEPSSIPSKPGPERPASGAAARPVSGLPLPSKVLPDRRAPAATAASSGGPAARPDVVNLSWSEQDIENRWGLFQGGRYTSVNKLLSFLLAMLASFFFLAAMFLLYYHNSVPILHGLAECFWRTPNWYVTIFATLFFFWGVVIVLLKLPKLRLQRQALALAAVPQSRDFVLNETTARTVLERMRSLVDDTRHFILLNRIDRALSSLHNIGGVSDVSTILNSQADNDENQIASSYAIVNAMIWAIPVLGFVGTVLGLSLAMGKFKLNADASQIRDSLGPVVSGLSTAFETTLVGLVFALLLHLLSDLMQQKETDFLDECNDYCHAYVVSKLRVRREGGES